MKVISPGIWSPHPLPLFYSFQKVDKNHYQLSIFNYQLLITHYHLRFH